MVDLDHAFETRESSSSLSSFPFRGLLFDLDGTLVNSLPAVDRAWRTWSIEFGLDPDVIVPQIHGRRAVDSIARLAPHLDQQAAFSRLEHLEATDTEGVVPMPGALEFIKQIQDIPWGIVTSGSRPIAYPRIKAGGIQPPDIFVTAEEISRGKPDPEAFLTGAARLGIPPSDIIAFEDTLAGVRSAKGAGMRVVGLSEEAAEEADIQISDYSSLTIDHSSSPFILSLK